MKQNLTKLKGEKDKSSYSKIFKILIQGYYFSIDFSNRVEGKEEVGEEREKEKHPFERDTSTGYLRDMSQPGPGIEACNP